MKFVFVILHYVTSDDTIECIESINTMFRKKNIEIIVVDNNSPITFESEMIKKRSVPSNVHIIRSNKNLGFANGNNLGIHLASNKMNPDFIICLNNDVEMIQQDMLEKIEAEYLRSEFWVLGPQILTADGRYDSSPIIETLNIDSAQVEKMISERKHDLLLSYCYMGFGQRLVRFAKSRLIRPKSYSKRFCLFRHENVPIQGSCIIFSRRFLQNFSGFNSETFFYQEENILFVEVCGKNGKIIYNPAIRIFHKEDSATNALSLGTRKKRIFMLSNEIKSLKILQRILSKNE